MLAHLGLLNAVVRDIPLPGFSPDGKEISSLSVRKVILEFPPDWQSCSARGYCSRVLYMILIWSRFTCCLDFPCCSLVLLTVDITGSIICALAKGAPTGTVVIPALLIILGFQLLLSAVGLDMLGMPQTLSVPARSRMQTRQIPAAVRRRCQRARVALAS